MCFFSTSYNPSPSKKIKNFVLNTVRCNYKKIIVHFQDFAREIPEYVDYKFTKKISDNWQEHKFNQI